MKSPFLFLLLAAFPLTATVLSVSITDETGTAKPARVYLTGSDGRIHTPEGVIVYDKVRPDGQKEQHFVPRDGSFEIDLPAGTYTIEIERGKEYVPVRETVTLGGSGRLSRSFRLERWTEMARRGWYSGDMHFHRPLADTAVLLEAEDLNAATPISRWRVGTRAISSDPDLEAFLEGHGPAGVVRVSPRRFFTVLNEELEPRNAALLTSRLGRRRSSLEYPLAAYGRIIRARGGLSDSEKATQLEFPVHVALGACNVVGLANNHFWRSGFYPGPWGSWPDELIREYPPNCAGFARAGFELYYAALNAGFPLKLSAGSASGVHPVPPGWSRVYVHVPGEFSPDAWFDALEAGHSFVTTGPMLLLTVDGHEPGDEVTGGEFPRPVRAEIRMLSLEPVTRAELVVNGDIHPVALKPEAGQPHTYTGSLTVTLKTTSWIAARYLKERPPTCDLAHTAPVYIRDGETPVPPRRRELEYLLSRTEALIKEVETGRTAAGEPTTILTPDPATKAETLRLFRQARRIYRDKLAK